MGALLRSTALVAMMMMVPLFVEGQLCLGVPAENGAVALAARAGIAWDETTYDGGVTVNLPGPLSVGGAYAHGMLYPLHRPANGVAGTLAYELSAGGVSVCPVAEAQYERMEYEGYRFAGTYSWTTTSLGVSLGGRLADWRGAYLVAHGGPRLIHFRRAYRDDRPDSSAELPPGLTLARSSVESSVEYGGHAGLTVGRGRLFLDARVGGTSHGDWEPAYTFSLGFVLGEPRS